jgi:GrpB-like predicted nucleotidyltransferase (UPF0157 family)
VGGATGQARRTLVAGRSSTLPARCTADGWRAGVLVPYDPRWPDQFVATMAELRRLGDASWEIEHIGSTAVPGLIATPIIDVAVRLDGLALAPEHVAGLEGAAGSSGAPCARTRS